MCIYFLPGHMALMGWHSWDGSALTRCDLATMYVCVYGLDSLCLSEGGCFKAHLYFPKEYPQRPPKMKFMSEMWHPNGEDTLLI